MSFFFAKDLFIIKFLEKYIFNIINPNRLKRNIFVKYSVLVKIIVVFDAPTNVVMPLQM